MVRCIPITFTQARTGLQGMRVNSSALRKRELGKTLVLVSILPNSPAVPVDCVRSHNVVRSSPVPAPCSKQSKIDCHADVLTQPGGCWQQQLGAPGGTRCQPENFLKLTPR